MTSRPGDPWSFVLAWPSEKAGLRALGSMQRERCLKTKDCAGDRQGSLLLPRKWLKKFMQGGGQVTLVA